MLTVLNILQHKYNPSADIMYTVQCTVGWNDFQKNNIQDYAEVEKCFLGRKNYKVKKSNWEFEFFFTFHRFSPTGNISQPRRSPNIILVKIIPPYTYTEH